MYLELKRGPKEIATPIIMTVGFIFFLLTFISFLILMLSRDFFMLPSLNKVEILVPCAIVFGALYFFFSNGDTTDRILKRFGDKEFKKSKKKILFEIIFWLFITCGILALPLGIYIGESQK